MALTFHRPLQPLSRLRHKVSAAFWLQSLACAVVAWSVMHGGITTAPPGAPPDAQSPPAASDTIARPDAFAPPAPDGASAPIAAAPSSSGAPGAPAPPSAIAVPAATGALAATPGAQPPAAGARSASAPVQLSVVPTLAEARLALSTIDVIVTRNDTLDRIFRRLKLNLADLATLRAVPGLHAMLDSLRPGERLRFKHHDGEFLGLERRLNESHTLKVSRDPTGLKADVLQDTLETRSRTVRGVIDHSLFEAGEAAGARSHFTAARWHPLLHRTRAHQGVDYAAPIGTPVRAAGDGRIRFAGRRGGYGNVVESEHIRSIVTVYGHLSRFAHGTRVGEHVTQGAVIAYVGMTGLATGPHLHYEYRVNGVFRNPQTVMLPSAGPIAARWREGLLARSAPLPARLSYPPVQMLVSR